MDMAKAFEPLERLSPTTYVTAMLASVGISLALYLMGKRTLALFVGLWAPTFLNFGLYLKQLQPSHERGLGRLGRAA